MRSGTMYKQGDIVVVPFPFSNLKSVKQRPVLILSKSLDIQNSDNIITCGLTSHIKTERYSVIIDNSDLENGSIPKQSRIKIDKLFTLDKTIIKKKVARVNQKTFRQVKEELLK